MLQAVVSLFFNRSLLKWIYILVLIGSGITASILYFALEQIGAKNIAVYDGSWTEYAGKKDSIIIKDQ